MKYYFNILLIFTILMRVNLSTASAQENLQNTLDFVPLTSATLSVLGYSVSETFKPMTHFKKDDLELTLNGFFNKYQIITKLGDGTTCYGDNLNSYSIGFDISYACTDDIFIDLLASYVNVDGNIEIGGSSKNYKLKSVAYSFQGGLGYDFMESDSWSVPVIGGLGVVKISSKGEQLSESIIPLYLTAGTIDQYLYRTYFSAGISYKFSFFENTFKVTPYMLVMIDLNQPKTKGEITGYTTATPVVGRFNIGDTYTKEGGDPQAIFPGVKFDYLSDSSWSASISISGLIFNSIDWYSETFLSGMKVRSYTLSITYKI